ncbi:MAG TPA: hypothetical protein VFQ35_13105 [Polyangiaceae bacterium]|nr:hypothetical protein [Polyangiaceae bacterium]
MKESSDDLAPGSLPPLDKSEDAELDDAALGGLLDPLPTLDGSSDDGDASALDTGVETFDILADNVEDAATTIDFGGNFADLLVLPSENEESDDSVGLAAADPDFVNAPEVPEPRDDEEGLDEPGLGLGSLPELVQGEDDEGVDDTGELPASARFGDEPRPAVAARAWALAGPELKLEPCAAIASIDGIVVAASSDLFWFSPGNLTPVRLEAGSSHVHSIALLGGGWDYAACATASGKLIRRGRLASASEELRRVREELGSPGREVFDLCQPGPAFPHTLLLRTASGKLLRSDDDGVTFRRVSEHKVVALAPHGPPALALSAEGVLLSSDDGAGSFREVKLQGLAARVALAKSPLIAGNAKAVLLGDSSLGVLLSKDRSEHFVRLPGTLGVSALCMGGDAESPCGFAAVYDDARDHTLLLRIDLATFGVSTIASIDADSSDEDEMTEGARVAALVWDNVYGRLWAAGGFGVKAYAPTDG